MKGINKGIIRRIMAALLCVLISFAYMPFNVYALEGSDDEVSIDADALAGAGEARVVADGSDEDADELLEGYVDSVTKAELSGKKRKASEDKRRDKLSDNEKVIYDEIKAFVDRVAAGQEARAVTSIELGQIFNRYYVQDGNYNVITSESLGISSAVMVKKTDEDGDWYWDFSDQAKAKLYDFDAIIDALMADEPYALYWYDKTRGIGYRINGMLVYIDASESDLFVANGTDPELVMGFTVSEDYLAAGGDDFSVDTAKTAAASQAAVNAAAIIADNASEDDIDKLYAYKETVCERTSYNFDAAEDEYYPYGDPWQMIYVFDDDPDTNVVCEGYSKAFQFLCDHTDFSSDIECDSVTGVSTSVYGAGLHMWNILHMDDGLNYMADITNSDEEAAGEDGGLFISPAMEGGSVSGGYWYDLNGDGRGDVGYGYDDETLRLFSDSELAMSSSEYTPDPHGMTDVTYEWADDLSSCTASGTLEDTGEAATETVSASISVKTPANCGRDGTTAYKAVFETRGFATQRKYVDNIPATGNHLWDAGKVTKAAKEGVAGVRTYTCKVCSHTKTQSIPAIKYPTDLPAVKIVKPAAGKKKMTVKWKKVTKKNLSKIDGIEIQVATDSGFKNIVKTATAGKKKTSKVIKGLKSKTKYYVRVRAYKNKNGKHVSVWKSKSAKVK